MLGKEKSVKLTQFVVRLCYVLLGAAAIALPFIFKYGIFEFDILNKISSYVMGPFYAVVPAGYVALICLDKLLINVRKELVFDVKNVKLLSIISWACFYAGLVGFASFIIIMLMHFMFETLLVLAMGEMFMALVVRVVKNVFESAIEIKAENDLTV